MERRELLRRPMPHTNWTVVILTLGGLLAGLTLALIAGFATVPTDATDPAARGVQDEARMARYLETLSAKDQRTYFRTLEHALKKSKPMQAYVTYLTKQAFNPKKD